MKTGIVKFSREFVTQIGTKEWVGLEMEYDMNTECPRDVLTNAKTIVEQWHKESNSQGLIDNFNNFVPPGPPPVINVQRTSEDIRIAELVGDILKCTSLEGDNGLYSYQKLSTTCKEAGIAYNTMYNKLSKLKNNAIN